MTMLLSSPVLVCAPFLCFFFLMIRRPPRSTLFPYDALPIWLGADYGRLWAEQLADPRDYYERVRAAFNRTHQPHHLLYLLARCVKAAVRYNREGDFNQGADHRRLGARPEVMCARLTGTARVLSGTRAHVADYADVLGAADRADVVYLDP